MLSLSTIRFRFFPKVLVFFILTMSAARMMATNTARALVKPRMSFVRMRVPIQEQLRVEEALFRVDKERNWFIYNEEKTPVTIVMGISGKPEQLLQLDAVKRYASSACFPLYWCTFSSLRSLICVCM